MNRNVPAFDPRSSRAERRGFIRTEPISLPLADGAIGTEEPGITLWAGPKVLFINALFPGIDLDTLQINIAGNRLVFSGPLYPVPADPMPRKRGVRRNQIPFSHVLELPYPVDSDRAEVRRENGLVSIILKKDQSRVSSGNARLESSILTCMKRYFGDSCKQPQNRADEDRILRSLDKYFAYIVQGGIAEGRRSA